MDTTVNPAVIDLALEAVVSRGQDTVVALQQRITSTACPACSTGA
jgi:hypothetical protein